MLLCVFIQYIRVYIVDLLFIDASRAVSQDFICIKSVLQKVLAGNILAGNLALRLITKNMNGEVILLEHTLIACNQFFFDDKG